jgi:hypothetical protein
VNSRVTAERHKARLVAEVGKSSGKTSINGEMFYFYILVI